jgi:hypothetical protein
VHRPVAREAARLVSARGGSPRIDAAHHACPAQAAGRHSGPHLQICATLIDTVAECGAVTEKAAAPITVGDKHGGGLRLARLS